MSTKEEIIKNLNKCSRISGCSIPICPLDPEANQRVYCKGENRCPFTIKKKGVSQKGIRTLIPTTILKFIPKSNVKTLNKRNQKGWYNLHKK